MKRIFLPILTFLFMAAGLQAQDLSSLTTPLETPDGSQTSIAEVGKNKVTVVSFWATWCKPCKEEMKAVHDMYSELQGQGIEYIAVSIDNTKTMARVGPYVNSKGYEFPVLLDPNKEIFEIVNGTEVPYTLVYDSKGALRFKHDGYLEGDEEHLKEEVMSLVSETESGS